MHATIELALTAASFLGITTNSFVLAVNLRDWKFKRDLKASDYYITSTALSNLSLQLWLGFTWFCDNGWINDSFCQINFALIIISTHCSIVMAGVLCLFYCFKIVVFNHWFLQMCRREYFESYKYIILRFVLFCTVLGLPLAWMKNSSISSDSPFLNISSVSNFHDTRVAIYFEGYKIFALSFGFTFPSLLSLLSVGCITLSLVKHMKRMQGTMEKKYGVLVDAHQRAAMTVLSLLVLILIHFVTSVIILMEVFPVQDSRLTICRVISRLYPLTVGIILLRGNSKLRRVTSEIKRKAMGALKLLTSKKENPSVHII